MDYEIQPTSRSNLRLFAKLFRTICGFSESEPIDPVLLLDDVLSELDLERQEYLIKTLSFNQLFITTAEMQKKLTDEFTDAAIFRVVKGKVEK